jgi:hypothetical protein
MHPQIKEVINTLLHTLGKVHVRLSAGEQTPLGKIIGRVYYNTNVLEGLTRDERFGYPHNGGQHTLELHCKPMDAIAMLEMIKEVALDKLCRTEEERAVANQLSFVSQEIHRLRVAARKAATQV